MEFNTSCLEGCSPAQVINLGFAINDISTVEVYNNCDCKYDKNELQYAYSLDNICWTCYMSYDEILKMTIALKQDFYIRIKIYNVVGYLIVDNNKTNDYSTQIFQGFDFKLDNCANNKNMFNPYANLDCAISLQTQLAETVACMFGVPIYYFKLAPNQGSKDITFKEYALMDVEAVKQIKLIIKDGQMPSSKPEFTEFGLDWQTDWETEISKGMFATAFGMKAQPMEGDLIYIPMMKRMWMVNGAYEEKNENLMWNSTTFRLMLVKYQEKASVNLGDTEELVDSFVKNKYEDLFGDEENVGSGSDAVDAPLYAANNLYAVFESDATRKYVSCKDLNIYDNKVYYKGTLISDSKYDFALNTEKKTIIYQKQYCGTEGSVSFIINPLSNQILGDNNVNNKIPLLEIGDIKIMIEQKLFKTNLSINKAPEIEATIDNNQIYFVIFRWSKVLNYVELSVFGYVANEKVPEYKRTSAHYWFDLDKPVSTKISKFNIELVQENKKDVVLNSLYGSITNIKVFDVYNDAISDLIQQYPNHQHLIINDTARKLVDLPGVLLH